MAACGQDELPGKRRPRQGPEPGGDVVDLWSAPPGALNLDDSSLWGEDGGLARLAAVLPILGEDLDPTSALSLAAGADPVLHPDSPPVRRTLPGVEPLSAYRGRRRKMVSEVAAPAPVEGLSVAGVLLLLAAVYVTSVVVAILWTPNSSPEASTGGHQGRIVTDGPLPCPMYQVPDPHRLSEPYRVSDPGRTTSTEPGACFFVG